jgi:hypothetical protein
MTRCRGRHESDVAFIVPKRERERDRESYGESLDSTGNDDDRIRLGLSATTVLEYTLS